MGIDLVITEGLVANGGSETTGTGLMRSDAIGLDRLTTVVDSQPQEPPPISIQWESHGE